MINSSELVQSEVTQFLVDNTQNRNDERILSNINIVDLEQFYCDESGDEMINRAYENIIKIKARKKRSNVNRNNSNDVSSEQMNTVNVQCEF